MIYFRAVDVSAYQSAVPWDTLNANGVCDIAIIKGGQGQYTRDHVNQARAKGIKHIILYFWNDPTVAAFYQILTIQNDIKEYNPIAVFLDVEQWWANWDQYWQFLAGKLTIAQMAVKSPQSISDNALAVLNGVRQSYPKLIIGVYTALWFVSGWSQPIAQWIKNWPLWDASYFDYSKATYKVTYDYIRTVPPATYIPALPTGATEWKFLQYSSRMVYPGQIYPYDSNIFNGGEREFLAWAGLTPPPPTDHDILMSLVEWAKTVGYPA